MTDAHTTHRPKGRALRTALAAWLLAMLVLYGLGGASSRLLGPLHVHAHALDHVLDHLSGHAHRGGTALRHHHPAGDDEDVVVIAEPADGDGSPQAGWAWQVVAPGSPWITPAADTRRERWSATGAARFDSRLPDRLERPPRA